MTKGPEEMSNTTVGRSPRTPAKHALMNALLGREVGASSNIKDVNQLIWFDLTAGDGIVATDAEWERNCSPGLLAFHARASRHPVIIRLSERALETCNRLEESLHDHLPGLGYTCVATNPMDITKHRSAWVHEPTRSFPGDVVLIVAREDGCNVDTKELTITEQTAVLVCHDPNTVAQRAMRPTFMAEIRDQTPWCQALATMGCNPGGLKRLPVDERRTWFEFVAEQGQNLHGWHDLTLAAIERDDAQWAYLVTHAKAWRSETIRACRAAFKPHGMTLEVASLKSQPHEFAELQRRLFLTKREREA